MTTRTAFRFPEWRRSVWCKILVAAAIAAITVGLLTPPPSAGANDAILAHDTMSRSQPKGWGSAETGGSYTAQAAGTAAVSGGTASLVSPAPAGTASMTLGSVRALDAVGRVDIALPSLPKGSSKVYVRNFIRGTTRTSYDAMIVVGSDGKSQLVLERFRNGVNATFSTGSGPQIKAGKPVTLEISAVGVNPVRLGLKAWSAGSPEPAAWSALATDSSTDRLTPAGPVGISVYASKFGGVTPVRFDNLLTRTTSTAPANPAPARPTPPTVDPSGTKYAGKRFTAGAPAPTIKSYSVPASATYVAPTGSDLNPGTTAKPFRTISAATKAAKSGGTVVLRGGVYHEQAIVYAHDRLTVEAYPGETVWLDGSSVVSGWTKSNNVWVKSGWTTFFDASPTYTTGAPDSTEENWQWINPAHPMASHPDQIWVDGKALTQVSTRAAVTSGTFFVDQPAKQLVLGSDPTKRKIEASTLSQAMSIRSKNSLIRGIGVRRYATSVPMMGAISTYFSGVTLENMTIVDNATTGLFIGADKARLKHVTVRNNGLLGIGASHADDLTVDSVLSASNNSQHFNNAPVSGAFKITKSRDVSIRNSAFVNNFGQGPWFDESVHNANFSHNDVIANTGDGLVLELSARFTIADNLIADNGGDAVAVLNSGDAAIWNNTAVGNGGGIDISQDQRLASDLSLPGHDKRQHLPDPTVPWVVKNVSVINNVISVNQGDFILRVVDWTHKRSGAQMVTQSNGNLLHRASSTAPPAVVVWSQAGTGTVAFPTLETYRAAVGRDSSSFLVTGTSPLTPSDTLTPQYASRANSALPIPATISAAAPPLRQGSRVLGASHSSS